MALNAYLTLTGQKQGQIKGSVTQKGRENSIMVVAVDFEIASPRDEASGLPSGKRQHKPLTIMKEVDISTPLLYNALCQNENIPTWQLKFFSTQIGTDRTTGTAMEQNYFTIDLVNASVCGITFVMENNKDPDLMKYNEMQKVSFVYQKITWTWVKGGVTASDDWEAPMS